MRPVAAPAAPTEAASHRFLTLPFHSVASKHIQEGFMWTGCCHDPVHGGIDYIQGTLDRRPRGAASRSTRLPVAWPARSSPSTQKGCIPGVGNRVLIKTRVAGTVYYHYYGHFRAIVSRIPRGGARVHVDRGDLLGWAGHSGDPCCVIHLHFQLMTANWKTIDPYGLYGTRSRYPDPAGTNGKRSGSSSYWLSDPPRNSVPSAAGCAEHGQRRSGSPSPSPDERVGPGSTRRIAGRPGMAGLPHVSHWPYRLL